MRIGLVCPYPLSRAGGVQEHVKGLYDYLEKNHEVKIIAPGKPRKNHDRNIIFLGRFINVNTNASQGYISLYTGSPKKILEKEEFDILHFHEPAVPFLSIQFLLSSNAINVATFHAYLEDSILVKLPPYCIRPINKYLLSKLDGIISISEPATKFTEKVLKRKPIIIPNGVDLTRFNESVHKIDKYDDEKLNILFVGNLVKRKGIIYLLQAFESLKRRYDDIRLIIAGEGPDRQKSQDYVEEYDIKDVNFEGYIPDEELPRYYATAHIFCSPATHGESFGVVLLEAMASGLPIVAFENVGYRQVIKDRARRFLVPSRNVRALTKALEVLIKDKSLREEMGSWGLQEAQEYSWESVGSKVERFYEKIINKKISHYP